MSPSESERLPYRLLTGDASRAFCERVSAALRDGYMLYGDPVMSSDGEGLTTAQAVVLPEHYPSAETS
jgi:hypothetical protein